MPALDAPVTAISGVGPEYTERLERLGVTTVRDLLLLVPRRHDDLSQVTPIAMLRPGMRTTVRGTVHHARVYQTIRQKIWLSEATIGEGQARLKVVWFNQKYLGKSLRMGEELFLAGEVDFDYPSGLTMKNPDLERISPHPSHVARIVPVYPQTEGLTSRWLRPKIQALLPLADQLPEFLPKEVLERQRLMPRSEAIREVHFPSNQQMLAAARHRLAFEKVFILQVAAQLSKRARRRQSAVAIPFDQPAARGFVNALPFQLTRDQRKAAWEILQDLSRPAPMNRLLEGDVGSGKTVVAAMAMHHVAQAGYQSVLLSPTEILARQHADVVEALLRPFGVTVGLLLGSTPAGQRGPLLKAIEEGSVSVVIGTHALLEQPVRFQRLAFAVVDEQHRFGVEQRQTLREKGGAGYLHFLSMSATPIPRTLGLTLYGDLDISTIEEMPPGRRQVITRLAPPNKRADAYDFIRKQIAQGRQAFVICPLIQESDKLGVRAATDELKKLQTDVFPELADRIALLHGRLKTEEKEAVMARFAAGSLAILVATSVVEVGIDVPNASVMMVEDADRFGLAQLHQFRGRVGRGAHQSYCFLFTELDDPRIRERLNALVENNSGFQLAEVDLRLRGMGDLYGDTLKQHGVEFDLANLLNARLIADAQGEAARLVDADPNLGAEPALRRELAAYRRVFALD